MAGKGLMLFFLFLFDLVSFMFDRVSVGWIRVWVFRVDWVGNVGLVGLVWALWFWVRF